MIELRAIGERVAARRRPRPEMRAIDNEAQIEFLKEFIAPLLDQASWRDDHNASRIGSHDQLADVEPCHNRLAGARIVREDEPQRLTGEHRLVDGGDLMGKRVNVRAMDRHHRVEQEREVYPLRLARELERIPIAVERPRALDGCLRDGRLVGPAEQTFVYRAVGGAIDDL